MALVSPASRGSLPVTSKRRKDILPPMSLKFSGAGDDHAGSLPSTGDLKFIGLQSKGRKNASFYDNQADQDPELARPPIGKEKTRDTIT